MKWMKVQILSSYVLAIVLQGHKKCIGCYHLDGFRTLPSGRRECYEFYGCYYHGRVKCFPDHSRFVRKRLREDGTILFKPH